MILINDAIESAVWIEVNGTVPGNVFRDPFDVCYRVKISGFSKIDLHNIGQYDGHQDWQERFMREIGFDANLWKIDLAVVNMEKCEMPPFWIKETLCLEDQDGYKYKICEDSWLNLGAPYSKESGLATFHLLHLPPKIKKTGSYAIELPEFYDEIYISAHNGTAKEI